jgi:hypothetical protein
MWIVLVLLNILWVAIPFTALPVFADTSTLIHSWSQRFGDSNIQYEPYITTNAAGNIVVAVSYLGTVDFGGGPLTSAGGRDIAVAKFDNSGSHIWSKHFGDIDDQYIVRAAFDEAGNIIFAGHFEGAVDFGGGAMMSVQPWDIFLVKLDAGGNHVWSHEFGDSSAAWVGGVAANDAGNIFLTGGFQDGTVDFGGGSLAPAGPGNPDTYLVKFDSNGNHIWSRRFGNGGSEKGQQVVIDAVGNVVTRGIFTHSIDLGGGDLVCPGFGASYVAKFNSSGNHIWSHCYSDLDEIVRGIAVDAAGNVVFTGAFRGTVDFGGGPLTSAGGRDVFLVKLDKDGDHVWSRHYGDGDSQAALSVTTGVGGTIAITGDFSGTVNYGGGVLTETGLGDIFVAQFYADGNHVASARYGDAAVQHGNDIATIDVGDIILSGTFRGTVDFGGGPLTSTGNQDIYLAKLSIDPVTSIEDMPASNAMQVSIYPNPFNPTATIRFFVNDDGPVHLAVYDITGGHVTTLIDRHMSSGVHTADWDGLDNYGDAVASGVYFYRLTAGKQTLTRKAVLLK